MKTTVICVLLALVAIALASQERSGTCPNNCSSHGTCSSGTCNCNVGYTGSDCSIPLTALNSAQEIKDNVTTFQWNYYTITVPTIGSTLTTLMNQTGSGDCDLYLQVGTLPTRSSYFARDISTSKNGKVSASNIQTAGAWYIGVYGFSACSYLLSATLSGSCPNSCSGHGICTSGSCTCNSGWSGNDCSQALVDINFNSPTAGNVDSLKMNGYRVHLTSANYLGVTLTQTTPGDCDLYVRFNAAPTIWNWDYANVTRGNLSTITVEGARSGYYYIGVYGFQACSYILVALSQSECPNQCSQHGSCSGTSCSCTDGYSGSYCNTKTAALQPDEVANGYVEYNTWNYFTYHSNSDANLMIHVNQSSNKDDCDLYVRAGSNPTRFQFDYQELSTDAYYELAINDPGDTTWYIGIYGWAKCVFQIWIDETTACPSNCNNHGTCAGNGICECDSGYSGAACELESTALLPGVPQSGVVNPDGWVIYPYSVVNTSSVHIVVKETSSSGYLWVFVAKTTPSLRNYLYSDTSNSNLHVISFDFTTDVTDTFQIGVFGNPYSIESTAFNIVAWSPDFSASDK